MRAWPKRCLLQGTLHGYLPPLRHPLRRALPAQLSSGLDTLGFEPRAFRMRSGCDTTTPCAHLSICAKKTKFASGRPQTPANRDCALLMRCSWRSSQADIAFQCERCARQRRREPSAHNNTMDTLGFEPRAFRMQSGCDTTTPCAHMFFPSALKTIWSRQF